MTSPTQRSLAYARKMGWSAAVVERFNPHARVRQDLWGIIDLLVLDDKEGVLGVQACAGASHAARASKARALIRGAPPESATPRTQSSAQRNAIALLRFLINWNRLEIWSWSKTGARGKRKTWTLRREPILGHQVIPVGYTNLETP